MILLQNSPKEMSFDDTPVILLRERILHAEGTCDCPTRARAMRSGYLLAESISKTVTIAHFVIKNSQDIKKAERLLLPATTFRKTILRHTV